MRGATELCEAEGVVEYSGLFVSNENLCYIKTPSVSRMADTSLGEGGLG